jgi:hypothetical protein
MGMHDVSNTAPSAVFSLFSPVLSSGAPSTGPATGTTTVSLTGLFFSGTTAVRFGSIPAAFTVLSDTQISAVAPPGVGTVQITVTNNIGTSNQPVYFTYIPVALPLVSSVAPSSGPTDGGTQVTIGGTGLAGATAVRFGSAPAASFTVLSDTQIKAVVPPGLAGPVPIVVTTPSGSSAESVHFYYSAAPVLATVSPPSGPSAGGNTVTLTGSAFTGATAVRFGATAAASVTVLSDTKLTAVAPPGTGTAAVTVVTAAGVSNQLPYVYVAAPTLTAVVPDIGPASGGQSVTLTGTGLTQATAVTFGAIAAPYVVLSDTRIVATSPAGPAGPVDVKVTTAGGQTGPRMYTRVAAPEI